MSAIVETKRPIAKMPWLANSRVSSALQPQIPIRLQLAYPKARPGEHEPLAIVKTAMGS
jgi:hypothetical protein